VNCRGGANGSENVPVVPSLSTKESRVMLFLQCRERLKELQKSRIITRKIVSESPIRIEYHLTDLGKKLEPVLGAAGSFSMSSMPREVFKDGKARNPEEIIQMKLVT